MSDPIVVTAVFVPKKGSFDSVAEIISAAIAEIHQEAGCILYAIHRDPNDRIVMLEKWESTELLDAHGAAEPVKRMNARLEGLLEVPVLVTRMSPMPAGTAAQGQL